MTSTRNRLLSAFQAMGWRRMTLVGVLLSVITGVALGQSLYTFHYAEGLSYFSPNPRACVNCHIMQAQFDGWQKGSHHSVAKCIDCHLPHDFIGKYYSRDFIRRNVLKQTAEDIEEIDDAIKSETAEGKIISPEGTAAPGTAPDAPQEGGQGGAPAPERNVTIGEVVGGDEDEDEDGNPKE